MAKKKIKVKRKATVEAPSEMKPTLTVKASQLSGQDLDVGETAKFVVEGRVMSETIERYEPDKGKKTYSIDVSRVRLFKD